MKQEAAVADGSGDVRVAAEKSAAVTFENTDVQSEPKTHTPFAFFPALNVAVKWPSRFAAFATCKMFLPTPSCVSSMCAMHCRKTKP